MKDLTAELAAIIGQPESETLEYKAVLPPSKLIAQLICGFANAQGGFIILGVYDQSRGIEIKGLSEDFQATAMTHKALDMLDPRPQTDYQYFTHEGKKLYAIKVEKSNTMIRLENKIYIRTGGTTALKTRILSVLEKAVLIR